MVIHTSPLTREANMKCVFVRHSSDWRSFGERNWTAMVKGLQAQPPALRVVGLDAEWFFSSPISVVQVASATHCFVIHLAFLDNRALPPSVKAVFEDASIVKCGVGVSQDVSRLQKEQQLTMQSILDIDTFSVLLGLSEPGKTSLAALAKVVCNTTMEKQKKITRSNWERYLSESQISYAADDAVASFLVGRRVMMAAAEKQHMMLTDKNFSAARWLARWSAHASAAFIRDRGTLQRAAVAARKKQAEEAKVHVESEGQGMVATPPSKKPPTPLDPSPDTATDYAIHRVSVLDEKGTAFTTCSRAHAFFYTEEANIATVTRSSAESAQQMPLEIRLNTVPEGEWCTRLCVMHRIGQCELAEHCPHAHGVALLAEPAQKLLRDPEGRACAICLSTDKLVRFSVVPTTLRVCLPTPFCNDTDDTHIPLCRDCVTFASEYVKHELNVFYHQNEDVFARVKKQSTAAAHCVHDAKTLLSPEKLKDLSAEKQAEMQQGILANMPLLCAVAAVQERGDGEERSDTAVATRAQTDTLSPELLERLSRIDGGLLKPYLTVHALIGEDRHKAQAFIEHWRVYFTEVCGLLDKPHNHWTYAEWVQYWTSQPSHRHLQRAHGECEGADEEEDGHPSCRTHTPPTAESPPQ